MKHSNRIIAGLVFLILSVSPEILNAQENLTITGFNEISVSSGIDLYLTQSNSENIRINAHPDLLKNVIIEKQGKTLVIKYKNNLNWSKLVKNQGTKVYVNYKNLQALNASGGSDVISQNTIKTESLALNASGGSDMELQVNVKELDIHASGGSDIDLKGSAVNMSAAISGGSDLDAFSLTTENARVTASGGSDANIQVTKALDASANGGSDVNYKGNPAVKKSSDKSGDVNKVN